MPDRSVLADRLALDFSQQPEHNQNRRPARPASSRGAATVSSTFSHCPPTAIINLVRRCFWAARRHHSRRGQATPSGVTAITSNSIGKSVSLYGAQGSELRRRVATHWRSAPTILDDTPLAPRARPTTTTRTTKTPIVQYWRQNSFAYLCILQYLNINVNISIQLHHHHHHRQQQQQRQRQQLPRPHLVASCQRFRMGPIDLSPYSRALAHRRRDISIFCFYDLVSFALNVFVCARFSLLAGWPARQPIQSTGRLALPSRYLWPSTFTFSLCVPVVRNSSTLGRCQYNTCGPVRQSFKECQPANEQLE